VPTQVLIVISVTFALDFLAVGVHYEALSRTSNGRGVWG
jgi:predicted phosphoribosyltransferase